MTETMETVHLVRPEVNGQLYCGAVGELPFKEGTLEGVTCPSCQQVMVDERREAMAQRWFVHPAALNTPTRLGLLGAVVEWQQNGERGLLICNSEADGAVCAERIAEEWRSAGFVEVKMVTTWAVTSPNRLLFYTITVYWPGLMREELHVGTTWQNNRGASEVCSDVLLSLVEQHAAKWGKGHLVGFNLMPESQ